MNKNLAERIIEILLVNLPDVVVEIGPGGGYFTDLIASKVKSLVLIEKGNGPRERLVVGGSSHCMACWDEPELYWKKVKEFCDKYINIE